MKGYKIFKLPFIIFLFITTFVIYFVRQNLYDNSQNDKTDSANGNIYYAEGVTINKKNGNNLIVSLHADKIIYRKRTSNFFDYKNLKEIYIENAEIDIVKEGPTFIDKLYEDMKIFSNEYLTNNSFKNERPDAKKEIMSRILFNNIVMRMHYPEQKTIFSRASNAEINYNIDNIVLNDDVFVKDEKGIEYYAKSAVFSGKYNGFYFPIGFVTKRYKTNRKVFYVINRLGDVYKSENVPQINYIDLLSKMEGELFLKMMRRLPPQIRLILGIPKA